MQAASVGLADSVQILLDANVNPNLTDNSGMGILQLAKNSSGAVRKLLLKWRGPSGEELQVTYAASKKKNPERGPQPTKNHSKNYWPIHRVP